MGVSWRDLVRCLQSSQHTQAWSRLEIFLLLTNIWRQDGANKEAASFIFVLWESNAAGAGEPGFQGRA